MSAATRIQALPLGVNSFRLDITGDGWEVVVDGTGLTLDLRDRVGLVEKLLDALTDDERAGVREYLGGAK